MTYQAYVHKIKRIAVVFDAIRKRKVPILAFIAFLILLTSAFLFVNGMLIGDPSCEESIVYGQSLSCDSFVLFGDATYEYTSAENESWTDEMPRMPGEYLMRAVTVRSFGITSYSDPIPFTIEAYATEISAAGDRLPYGQKPEADIKLINGDKLQTVEFTYDNYDLNPTNVIPVAGSVRIIDKNGEDVTSAYALEFVPKTLEIIPRPLRVHISGAEKIYDGTPLTHTDWEIVAGSLLEGDEAILDFISAQTQVGLCENQANVTVINHELGENVSAYYDISLDVGNLVVTPRPITLKTHSGTHVYDAIVFSLNTYDIISEYGLPEGHTLHVDASTSLVDVASDIPNAFDAVRITLADGSDVTSNFDISYECGTLTVTKRPLLLQTESKDKVYDATALSAPHATPVNTGELLAGHTVEILQSAVVINAGLYENTVEEIRILSGSGDASKDVTHNYEISYQYGSLEIYKRPITLKGAGGEWMYDGLDHATTESGTVVSGSLVEGHTAKYTYTNSIRYVSASPTDNVFTALILNGEEDVTANYEISYEYDTLRITPRPITVQSDGRKVYDATPLTSQLPTVISELGLVDGDILAITTEGSITNAGSCENRILTATVTNADGDITDSYEITYAVGTLTVDKREVSLRSDGEKMYDGTPLTSTAYTDLESVYPLVEGHYAVLTTDGSIINVGTATNRITGYHIYDASENDVTDNYAVNTVEGTLTVTPRPITLKTHSGTHVYDATVFSLNTYDIISEYGLPEGHTLHVDASTSLVDVASDIPNAFDAVRITLADGSDVTSNFDISYECGTLTVTKRPLLLQTESKDKVYDATALSAPHATPVNTGELLAGHTVEILQSAVVINAGLYENTVEEIRILSGSGDASKDVTHNYEISYQYGSLEIYKRPITLKGAGGEWMYDGLDHATTESGTVVSGSLVEGHTAKYTYTNSIRYVSASPTDNVFTALILNGEEDVTANYEISYEYDTLRITPRPITVQSDGRKVYDATPLTSQLPTVISELGLVDGDILAITTEGSITNAGSCENRILTATVTNADGDITDSYEITYAVGTLTVDKREVSLRSDGEKMYDGTPLTSTAYTDLESVYPLVEGHYAVLTTDGSIINVGTATNRITGYHIYDASENDVTDNYAVNTVEGTLTVTPRPITVQMGSDQKIYDATELICRDISVVSDLKLVGDHVLYVTSSSSITNVGKIDNECYDFVIRSADHQDQTGNYTVTFIAGTLEITPRHVHIITHSANKIYDGTALVEQGFDYLENPAEDVYLPVNGHTFLVLSSAQVTTVTEGVIQNVFHTVDIRDDYGTSYLSNYIVTMDEGQLHITPRPIVVESMGAQKVYDDTPLTTTEYRIGGEGLVLDHILTIPEGGSASIRYVSESGTPNIFYSFDIVDGHGKSMMENYTVTDKIWGILTILKRTVVMQITDSRPVYNGEWQSSKTWELDLASPYDLVEGHIINVLSATEKIDAGEYINQFDRFEIMASDNRNVTDNYDLQWLEGTLTIQKRKVAIIPDGDSKIYDDEFFSHKNYHVFLDGEEYPYDFVLDHRLKVYTSLEIRYVKDSAPNEFYSYDVVSDGSGEILSRNYEIVILKEQSGLLEIKPRPIVIDIQDAEKMYDGTPLSQPEYLIPERTGYYLLVPKHYVASYDYPSYTNVGVYVNTFTNLIIMTQDDRDVTENYDIHMEDGQIVITKRPIKITTGSSEKYYDGTYLQDQSFVTDWNGMGDAQIPLVLDHAVLFEDSAAIKNVGTIPNEFYGVYIFSPATDEDVTDNYDLTFVWGTLTVKKREITVVTHGADQVYDGTPLSNPDFHIEGMGLAPGERFVPTVSTAIINANELDTAGNPIPVPNVFEEYEILNGSEPVDLENYDISFVYGDLVIYRRQVTIEISGRKSYDGLPMTTSVLQAIDLETPYNILPAHHIVFAINEMAVEVGTYDDALLEYLHILDENDQNMTSNYDISVQMDVAIEKAEIEITSSAEKMYDGTPLTCNEPQYKGFLHEDHEIILETYGSQTEVGSSPNKIISVVIRNILTGDDVTHNYNIIKVEGTLTVLDSTIYITSGSDEKEYDGTPLVNPSYEVEGSELPEGYRLIVTVTGSQTEIGESPNYFTYQILDADGNDVTDRMFVESTFGVLTVKEPQGTDISGGVATFIITMYSQLGGSYYVRDAFYGDYNGKSFDPAPRYTGGLVNPMMLTGLALQNEGFSGHIVKFKGGHYMVYNIVNGLATDTMAPTNISGNTYAYETIRGNAFQGILPDDLVEFERDYRAFVYDNYLQIPDNTKEVLLSLAAEAGLDPNSPNIISEVTAYIASSAEYSLDYAGWDYREDAVVEFLTEVKKGVCVHFASSATMMFRALGIPARYVTGAVPTAVAGEWADIEVIGHAWTEVYIDGLGWIYIDATGTGDSGELPETETTIIPTNKIFLKPHEIKVTFDGKLHGPSGDQFTIEGDLPEGYTITDVTFSAPQWKAGSYESNIIDFKVLDPDGKDVTMDYADLIMPESALLEILECPLTIRSSSATMVYNGLSLTANKTTGLNKDWWYSEGILPSGFTISLKITGTITKVGEKENTIEEVIIRNEKGENMTEHFKITLIPGTLTITPPRVG